MLYFCRAGKLVDLRVARKPFVRTLIVTSERVFCAAKPESNGKEGCFQFLAGGHGAVFLVGFITALDFLAHRRDLAPVK
jgi:hypothetical protein